jgi:fibronectin type 3 domain-containing protein
MDHNVSVAQQQFIRLGWSPNTEPHLSHYNLYRDTEPGTIVYLATIEKSDTIYTDTRIIEGETYYYKLTAVDVQGFESAPSNEVMATIKAIPGEDNENVAILEKFELEQNYPNPFNPKTTIEYRVPEYTNVSIIVYSVLGKEVRRVVNEYKEAGTYQVEWDGRDNDGRRVASGLYFYQMVTVNFYAVKKLMIQK